MVGPTAKLAQVFNLIQFLFLFNNITWNIPVSFYNWKPRICHARLHISLYLNFYTSINFRIRIALIRGGIWAFRKLDEEGGGWLHRRCPEKQSFSGWPLSTKFCLQQNMLTALYSIHCYIQEAGQIQFSYSFVTSNILHSDFVWSYLQPLVTSN